MKINKFLVLIFSSIMLINVQIKAQKDNDFWFIAPVVTPGHTNGSIPGNSPIGFIVFTYDMPANVTLSQPANTSFTPMTAYIPAHGLHIFDLSSFINTTVCTPENTVLNYGYHITSDADISAYYEVMPPHNMEIFALKGKNAVGTDFMIPFNNLYYNGPYNPIPVGGFNIVATEDGTEVTITPSHNLVGHPAGIPFTIHLNKGQTYFCKAVESDPANNAMGTIVSSNKPIAITIFDDSIGNISGPCWDLIGDQIIPLNIIGNEYIVVRGFLDNGDRIFITAPYNNTDIFINGTFQTTINSGQTYTYVLNDPQTSVYINTSNDVYVYHTTGFGCELGSAILPSIKCTGSSEVSFVRRTSEYLGLIITTKSGNEGNFLFNGNPTIITASDFLPVPGTGGQYVSARKEILTSVFPAGSTGILQNTAGTFHLGIINAGNGGCEYGFFSDYANYTFHITYNDIEIDTVYLCEGDSISLESNHILGANYEWTGPNNFYSNENTIVLNNLNLSNTGLYKLNGNIGNCTILGDSIYLQVNLKPIIDISTSSEICLNESSDLMVSSDITGTTFSWSNGLGTNPNVTVSPTATTTYSVTGTTAEGCTGTTSVTVTVHPLPTITAIATPSEICIGESSDLMVSSDITGTTFSWSNSLGTNPNVTVSPTTTTTYSVTGTTLEGCTSTASVTVTVHPLPTITATANPAEICLGESSDLTVSSDITGTTFSWSNGLGTNPNVTINPTTTTTYSVTGTTNEGCTGTAAVTVTVHPLPTINFLVNSAHCGHSDGSILLNINGAVPPYTFIWSNGYMDANLNNIVAGNYIVTVTDAIGCMSIANIYVEDLPGPTANFTFKPQMTTIENPIIYFQNYSIGATSYYWTFGDDNSSEEYAPNHVYIEPGSYHVVLYAIDDYNCIDTVGAQIIIKDISTFYIPNAIMPHRRNINSIFNIFGVNIDPDNFEMRIYNRWGNQIFYTTNPNIGWDGTYNGEYVQEGSYTYIFNFITETDGVKHTILGKVLVLY